MTPRDLPAILEGFRPRRVEYGKGQGSKEVQIRRPGRTGKRGPEGRRRRRHGPGPTYLSAVRLAQYAAVSHQGNPGLDSAPVGGSCLRVSELRQRFPGASA